MHTRNGVEVRALAALTASMNSMAVRSGFSRRRVLGLTTRSEGPILKPE